jgi:hypothetical protein
LPCPNIFAGGHNFHGKYEYVPVEHAKAVDVIVKNELTAMPNFGLDQRKPRKKINRTSKKPIREYKKKAKFNYYNWIWLLIYLKYLILNIVFLLKLFFSNSGTFRDYSTHFRNCRSLHFNFPDIVSITTVVSASSKLYHEVHF